MSDTREGTQNTPRSLKRLSADRGAARWMVVNAACMYVAGQTTKEDLTRYVERYQQANADLETAAGGDIQ